MKKKGGKFANDSYAADHNDRYGGSGYHAHPVSALSAIPRGKTHPQVHTISWQGAAGVCLWAAGHLLPEECKCFYRQSRHSRTSGNSAGGGASSLETADAIIYSRGHGVLYDFSTDGFLNKGIDSPIGDFSKLSRISIRMLRHYDEIGLLKPEKVDVFTGYRYYDESQLLDGERIQVLKNMGFGLSVIREIMENYADPGELKHFLEIKRHEIAEQEQILRQRKHLIDSTMEWLRKDGNIMGYDVSLKILPKRYVASVRQVIPSYEEEGRLWHIMMEETLGRNIRYDSPAYDLAVFYDGEYMERNVDVEVQRAVTGTYQDTEHVKFKTAPQVQYAGAVFKGQYEKITKVNEAVAKWCADNGYEFDGMGFNIYHVGPKDTQVPEDYVTEVCYPVKKKQ